MGSLGEGLHTKVLPVARAKGENQNRDFHRRWAGFIRRLRALTGRRVILLPHAFRPGRGDDRLHLRPILEYCPEVPASIADRVLAPSETAGIVASASFVIASRMHLALTALKCRVPYIALAYSRKYDQLVPGGDFQPVLDARLLGKERLFLEMESRFGYLWTRREEFRRSLEEHASRAEESAGRNIDLLMDMIGEKGI